MSEFAGASILTLHVCVCACVRVCVWGGGGQPPHTPGRGQMFSSASCKDQKRDREVNSQAAHILQVLQLRQ